jgi:ferric-dicitrate binding protein FerR (iron transport regulator)
MDELLIKYLLGEASPEEYTRVRDWQAASPENSRRLEQFRRVWEISRGTVPAAPDNREAWKRMRQRVETGQRAEEKMRVKPGPSEDAGGRRIGIGGSRSWQVAAVLAGLLCVGGATWVVLNQSREPAIGLATETHATQGAVTAGNLQTILTGDVARTDTLADGSIVILKKHSHISYPEGLKGEQRTIRLEGEAFFTVAPDASRPFIVRVDEIAVKVLGTSFNIRGEEGRTVVAVLSGAVAVSCNDSNLVVTAGKKFIFYRKTGKTAVTGNNNRYRREELIKPVPDTGKKKKADEPQFTLQKDRPQIMRDIIGDLVSKKIIPDKDSLSWFGLDGRQFVVNGRTMPDSLRILFKSRYIDPDGMGYFYGSPRDLRVYGRGYFYEKKDLYPH